MTLFTGDLVELREEMIKYYKDVLSKSTFPRDDYAEMIRLCLIFLGGMPTTETTSRAPGTLDG